MSISTQGPPQLGALPFQGSQSPIQPPTSQFSHSDTRSPGGFGASQPASMPLQSRASPPATANTTAPPGPTKPVFGVPLSRLYERDNIAVPMVVQQCIQAVELYGLELEGIYRQSGSLTHIQKLKAMFDTGMWLPPLVVSQVALLTSWQILPIKLSISGIPRTSTRT